MERRRRAGGLIEIRFSILLASIYLRPPDFLFFLPPEREALFAARERFAILPVLDTQRSLPFLFFTAIIPFPHEIDFAMSDVFGCMKSMTKKNQVDDTISFGTENENGLRIFPHRDHSARAPVRIPPMGGSEGPPTQRRRCCCCGACEHFCYAGTTVEDCINQPESQTHRLRCTTRVSPHIFGIP